MIMALLVPMTVIWVLNEIDWRQLFTWAEKKHENIYVSISALSNKSICGLKVFFSQKYRTLVVLYGKTTTKTKDEKFAVRQ